VKELSDHFHVSDFMGEELQDSLVAPDFADVCQDNKQGPNIIAYCIRLSLHLLADVKLQEAHDRSNERVQDWV